PAGLTRLFSVRLADYAPRSVLRSSSRSSRMSTQPEPAVTTSRGLSVASVALLLLAVAVIASGATYGLVASQYRDLIAIKDTAIATQQTAIRNFDNSLAGLRAENTDLRSRLAAAEEARDKQQAAIRNVDTTVSGLRAEIAAVQSRLAAAEAART